MGKKSKVRILSNNLLSPETVNALKNLNASYFIIDWLDEALQELDEENCSVAENLYIEATKSW